MIKRAVSKIVWVGRASVFTVGLAVVLALGLGVAGTALAAVPGDPFLLGRVNTIDALTALVGNRTAPMLRVDNNGTGTALALQVQPGVAPLVVTAGAGTATNLSADLVDGKNASAFIANASYKRESAVTPGQLLSDSTHVDQMTCDAGDTLLAGGPANVGPNSALLESFPAPGTSNGWKVRINKNGFTDNFNVVVLCTDQV